ncbi:MAG: hypothetical protein WCG22_07835 [Lentisphaerota bacterium]
MSRGIMPLQQLAPMTALLIALPLGAQDRGVSERAQPLIPRSAMPPAGMCRIWLKDVAASQQPAPTDCAAAIRARPQGASVLFGGEVKNTPVDARANGRSRAAQPVNVWELPTDPDARKRELARRALQEQTIRAALQPPDRAVTVKIVTELPPAKTPTGPQVTVPSSGTKVP